MNKTQKWVNIILWLLIIILGAYILFRGASLINETSVETKKTYIVDKLLAVLDDLAVETYMPGLAYSVNEPEVLGSVEAYVTEKVFESIPLYSYLKNSIDYEPVIEDSSTTNMIVYAEGVAEEEKEGESLAEGSETESQQEVVQDDSVQESTPEDTQTAGETQVAEAVNANLTPVAEINFDKLNDFDYLRNSFYIVDSMTTIDSSRLNAGSLLADNLSISEDSTAPQILIYHTHSQEAFIDSVAGDSSTTIVGVGDYLTKLLTEQYGFNVIHDTTEYDIIDGKLDRNAAYTVAGESLPRILEANPSIEVMIDLHRDGGETHLVTDVNGKQTARIMFFNGLSYSARNGDISYLPNPYVQDNLAFSLQMQVKAAQYFPNFSRGIYLKSLRYNMHFKARTLFIESGNQQNTVQEQLNAMEPLAAMLSEVLKGK